jgi:hypothetical protein
VSGVLRQRFLGREKPPPGENRRPEKTAAPGTAAYQHTMGRHTMINPKTGRRIYKTGRLGQGILKKKKLPAKKPPAKKPPAKKPPAKKPPAKKPSGKSYHGPGATKRPAPLIKKCKNGCCRPSARAMYDRGHLGPVRYGGAWHVMAFRSNGSPYYKKC